VRPRMAVAMGRAVLVHMQAGVVILRNIRIVRVLEVAGQMIVLVGENPLVQRGLGAREHGRRPAVIFLGARIGIVVEVVVQVAIGTANGEYAEFGFKAAVIDVGGPPEVAARGQFAELRRNRDS
jgi:hypothetical protein